MNNSSTDLTRNYTHTHPPTRNLQWDILKPQPCGLRLERNPARPGISGTCIWQTYARYFIVQSQGFRDEFKASMHDYMIHAHMTR